MFPREPRNRKRAQKGNLSKIQTLYYEKDIRFLLHEPIVWKFRDFKVFLRKLKKASEKKNWETVERLKANKPKYSLGKSRSCRFILESKFLFELNLSEELGGIRIEFGLEW